MNRDQKELRQLLHLDHFVTATNEYNGEPTDVIVAENEITNPEVLALIKPIDRYISHHLFCLPNYPYRFFLLTVNEGNKTKYTVCVDYDNKKSLFAQEDLDCFIEFLKRKS